MKRFFCIFSIIIFVAHVYAQSNPSRIDYATGDFYVGELNAQNKPHGKGTAFFADGSKYEGDWVNDKMHGTGTLTEADGSRYVGGFSNGQLHGKGILYFSIGMSYEGEWLNGDRQDGGNITPFRDERPSSGEKTYTNGDHYVGEFSIYGEPHGKGVFTKADGSKYEGTMANGNPHGLCTMTDSSGVIYVGRYNHGCRHGQFFIYFPDGRRVECEFRHDNLYGRVKFISAEGGVTYRDV